MFDNSGKRAACAVGAISSVVIIILIILYVGVGIIWMINYEGSDLFSLAPTEPYLTILESLILASAPVLVLLMLSIHILAGEEKKFFSLGALAFIIVMAAMTSCVHFIQLSVVRHSIAGQMPGMRMYLPGGQLSSWIAVDMFAWTFFFGMSLAFASCVFDGNRLQRNIRTFLLIGGIMCVFGTIGPLTGNLWLYFSAPIGFTIFTTISCIFLNKWFRQHALHLNSMHSSGT